MEMIALYILILIIPTIAHFCIMSNYSKYKNINNKKELTGFDVAREILDKNGMADMYIVETHGELTDHYDPTKKVVTLSSDVFHGNSISAVSIAAHESCHAIQDKENYKWLKMRTSMFPIVRFLTYAAYITFIISVILQMADALALSIVLVTISLVFQIITLPVEFDASKRAMKKLKEYDMVDKKEYDGVEKMLRSAAMTYVASVLSSLLNLFRLIMIYANRDR